MCLADSAVARRFGRAAAVGFLDGAVGAAAGGWGAAGGPPGVTERAGILRKPCASHELYNVRVLLFY